VLARLPLAASIAAQDRYEPNLRACRLAIFFPTAIERTEDALINLNTYPCATCQT
jgi:hypothetical protein